MAQGEDSFSTTIDASPEPFTLQRFAQAKGYVRRGGTALAGVTGGKLSFSNTLERVRTIRDDGKIDGADPTIATAKGSLTLRFDGTTLLAEAATSGHTAPTILSTFAHGATIRGRDGLWLAIPTAAAPRASGSRRHPHHLADTIFFGG